MVLILAVLFYVLVFYNQQFDNGKIHAPSSETFWRKPIENFRFMS